VTETEAMEKGNYDSIESPLIPPGIKVNHSKWSFLVFTEFKVAGIVLTYY
jgi:hypothetical protein